MKKLVMVLMFSMTCVVANAGGRGYFINANNLTRGTVPNARLDPSSVTLMGSDILTTGITYTKAPSDGASQQVLTTNGLGALSWTTKAGASALSNDTYTIVLGWGSSVMIATNTACPLPGACFWTGASTINVIDIQASIVIGSTVGSTFLQIQESTGGVQLPATQYLPVIPRFPLVEVTTSLASGVSSLSVVTTTGVTIPANTWVGLQVKQAPASGNMPQGINFLMNIWKKPYGGL